MATFTLQIVTPDGASFDGEAERIILRTINGDICIMPKHIDYATAVGTGVAKVTIDGKVRKAACSGGMLLVTNNHVRLVATTFEWQENIDTGRAARAKEAAEIAVKAAKDQQELFAAKARLMRALNRLSVNNK